MSRADRLIFFLLLCLFLPASSTVAQEKEIDRAKPLKSTTGAVLRSMVVPGWGQFYNESYYKAIAFAIIEGFQIEGIISFNDKLKASKKVNFYPERYEEGSDEWRSATASMDSTGQKVISYRERRNKTIWWFVGVVLLSMGDAYVDAQLYGIDVSPDISYKHEVTVGVTASINF